MKTRPVPLAVVACNQCGSEKIRVELTCYKEIDLIYDKGEIVEKVISPNLRYTTNPVKAVCLQCNADLQIQLKALPEEHKL